MSSIENSRYEELQEKLKINCEKCTGLCCVALYYIKTDGFPANKEIGVPCKHLMRDFRCAIHASLARKNLRGCLAYDCFGAGQKVTELYSSYVTWKSNSEKAEEIFEVFQIVFQLHQMAWYLFEALRFMTEKLLTENIEALLLENEQLSNQSPEAILRLDIEEYRSRVNQALEQTIKIIAIGSFPNIQKKDFLGRNFKRANLDGFDFSTALLIAANLEGCSLRRTIFLGADMRDANIKNTDLSACIFLTQMQLNGAKGNKNTKLPKNLLRPVSWKE